MTLAALLFIVSIVFELSVHLLPARQSMLRKLWSSVVIAGIIAGILASLLAPWTISGAIFIIIYIYRSINVLRIRAARMHPRYLQLATLRTSVWLIGLQTVAGGAYLYEVSYGLPYGAIAGWLLAATLLGAMAMMLTVRRRSRMTHLHSDLHPIVSKDLPTVSVLIPARNETDELQSCLATLTASDYPKLEILVLDDCSQNSRTPEIIRQFAHDGVRFVQGSEPSTTWLAKNHAYNTLAAAASGDILLFTGVDVRLETESIRRLVTYMLNHDTAMVSTLPLNTLSPGRMPLLQPMRYGFELAIPDRIRRTPPVLGSCWLITRRAYGKVGGFSAVSRMIIPEEFFARSVHATGRYAFLIGGNQYGVHSAKKAISQRDTAVRTAYPRFRRRPEYVALAGSLFVLMAGLPVATIITAVSTGAYVVHAAAALAVIIIISSTYGRVLMYMYDRSTLTDKLGLLPALVAMVATMHYSMYRYEFDEVIWKGRNVCIPAMHVVPKLPDF